MATFYIERLSGDPPRWMPLRVSSRLMHLSDLSGPSEGYPPSESPGNFSAFAGAPGMLARIRRDDCVIEVYRWEKVPVETGGDENSDRKWGWNFIGRNPNLTMPEREEPGPWSFLG